MSHINWLFFKKDNIINFDIETKYQSVSYTHLTLPTNREV